MNRRDAIYGIGLGATSVLLGRPFRIPLPAGRPRFEPDVELVLTAVPDAMQILPGERTKVWRYTGTVVKGPATTLTSVPGSYLGPTISLRRGQKVRIRFRNSLPEESIVHWHGLDVPEAADGHPRFAIQSGAEYVYEFEVANRAGTYWYHPHPHGRTGEQVYRGLAGIITVTDEEESALGLPSGAQDLVCVLQDRTFDERQQLSYLPTGMMEQMRGMTGDRLLVNGTASAAWSLATRAYRIRLLNGSSSRLYKLAWNDGTPVTLIGVDGGLLARPLRQRVLTLAPSQRADIIIDLGGREPGTSITLRSEAFNAEEVVPGMAGGPGRMGGGRGMAGVASGAPLSVLTLNVTRREQSSFSMPGVLVQDNWQEERSAPVRQVTLGFRAGQWLLDGRTFEMNAVTPEETVRAGSTQVWEFVNATGMMGRTMAHPLHVHGTQFRVVSRYMSAGGALSAPSIREGIVDQGWRDTVLVLPDETVRVQLRFTRHPGLYLYHCHILEHEDMGMMRNFRVV